MRSKVWKIALITGTVMAVVVTSALLTLAVTRSGPEVSAEGPVYNVTATAYDAVATGDAVYTPDNLIRFHVIANSDSDKDQALKRKIRDLVVQRMGPEFAKAKNITEARMVARARLDEIRTIAEDEVRAWGEKYPVKVLLGHYDFPVRTYGELTIPAGNYEAVRVVIGRGQGANWWCVLFPPLCFVDVSKGTGATDRNYAAASISPGPDRADLASAGSAQETVQVKFKFLEICERWLD